MSTETNKRGKLDIPRLKGEALEWVETALSIGMPYDYAVRAFLESFPSYAEHETLTEDEIFDDLKERFKEARTKTRRASYHRIKEKEASLKTFLDCIPVASPFTRLIELEKMRQDSSLKPEQLLKVLGAAAREVDILIPRETRSPFRPPGTVGLPDLWGAGSEKKPPDPFGGAMFQGKNANTGQETSEDS